MTKNESIENVKSSIIFTDDRCGYSCPFADNGDIVCILTNEVIFSWGDRHRTETCKALFKDE